jgi:uncharacterized protein YPO0396
MKPKRVDSVCFEKTITRAMKYQAKLEKLTRWLALARWEKGQIENLTFEYAYNDIEALAKNYHMTVAQLRAHYVQQKAKRLAVCQKKTDQLQKHIRWYQERLDAAENKLMQYPHAII